MSKKKPTIGLVLDVSNFDDNSDNGWCVVVLLDPVKLYLEMVDYYAAVFKEEVVQSHSGNPIRYLTIAGSNRKCESIIIDNPCRDSTVWIDADDNSDWEDDDEKVNYQTSNPPRKNKKLFGNDIELLTKLRPGYEAKLEAKYNLIEFLPYSTGVWFRLIAQDNVNSENFRHYTRMIKLYELRDMLEAAGFNVPEVK